MLAAEEELPVVPLLFDEACPLLLPLLPLSILLTASLICDNGPPTLPPGSSRGYWPDTIPIIRGKQMLALEKYFVDYFASVDIEQAKTQQNEK